MDPWIVESRIHHPRPKEGCRRSRQFFRQRPLSKKKFNFSSFRVFEFHRRLSRPRTLLSRIMSTVYLALCLRFISHCVYGLSRPALSFLNHVTVAVISLLPPRPCRRHVTVTALSLLLPRRYYRLSLFTPRRYYRLSLLPSRFLSSLFFVYNQDPCVSQELDVKRGPTVRNGESESSWRRLEMFGDGCQGNRESI